MPTPTASKLAHCPACDALAALNDDSFDGLFAQLAHARACRCGGAGDDFRDDTIEEVLTRAMADGRDLRAVSARLEAVLRVTAT